MRSGLFFFQVRKPRMAEINTHTHTHTMVQRIMGDVWKQSLFKLGGKLKEFKNHLGWLADTASNVLYYRLAS